MTIIKSLKGYDDYIKLLKSLKIIEGVLKSSIIIMMIT